MKTSFEVTLKAFLDRHLHSDIIAVVYSGINRLFRLSKDTPYILDNITMIIEQREYDQHLRMA